MSDQTDYGRRVGTTDSLPQQDIFGRLRGPGYSTRGIGEGQIVCYPPGTPRARVDAAIAPIRAWRDAQGAASKKTARKAPPAPEPPPAPQAGEEADADADA